ncbi:MAG: PQQ-like beta-propeller repeat protein [Candidatus Moraniibacteriota bacterium]|nr:MAG: PQQ-like beta-propeller repeat protein [Candidatus Moranbacteria bacterium]
MRILSYKKSHFLPTLFGMFFVFFFLSYSAHAGELELNPAWESVPGGSVSVMIPDGEGNVYLGGIFTQIGPYTGNGVKIDTTTNQMDVTFPKVNGTVRTSLSDGSGGWYIGGSFTKVGNVETVNVAHILSDGTVDPNFNPNTDGGGVYSLLLSGSNIYLGGRFTTVGGQIRNSLAKVNAITGALDENFNPDADDTINAIVLSGSNLYVGGEFYSIGGQSRSFLAKVNADTGVIDTNFNPESTITDDVFSLVLSGSSLYVGGQFSYFIGGYDRSDLAKLNATTGALDESFDPNVNNRVYSLVLSGSDLYLGGYFTTVGGQTRNRLAKVNATTGILDESFNPNANSYILSLALSGSDLYAGGDFTMVGGQTRNHLAKVNTTTGVLDENFNPNVDNAVRSLLTSGPDLYLGGDFTTVGGQTRNRLAKVNVLTGVLDPDFNPNVNSTIYSLALSNSILLAGGSFNSINNDSSYLNLASFTDPDILPPSLTLTPISSPTSDTTISITGTTIDELSDIYQVHYQVDSTEGEWTPCTPDDSLFDSSSEIFSCTPEEFQEGTHTVYIRVKDNALSQNETTQSLTFTIDLTYPSLTLNPLPPLTNDSTLILTGTTKDTDGTIQNVEYQLDSLSGSWTPCTSNDSLFEEQEESFTCTSPISLMETTSYTYDLQTM